MYANSKYHSTRFMPSPAHLFAEYVDNEIMSSDQRKKRFELEPECIQPLPSCASAQGLAYFLPEAPPLESMTFPCPSCAAPVYDGAIRRVNQCVCGCFCYREGSGECVIMSELPEMTRLEDRYFRVCQVPEAGQELQNLVSVTVGVFRETLEIECFQDGEVDYSLIAGEYLLPWLQQTTRCIGLGDMFKCGTAGFKVLAAYPAYGLVTNTTEVMCYQTLSSFSVFECVVCALDSSTVPPHFDAVLTKHFGAAPAHVHSGSWYSDQHLVIEGVELAVLECQPEEGIITPSTHIKLKRKSLAPIFRIELTPFNFNMDDGEDADTIEAVLKQFFRGWCKTVPKGRVFNVCGREFKTTWANNNFGYVAPFTELEFDPVGRRGMDLEQFMRMNHMFRQPFSGEMLDGLGGDKEDTEFLRALKESEASGEAECKQMPTRQLCTLPADPEQRQCTVCIEDYRVFDVIKTLPCRKPYTVHFFHEDCINDWLKKSRHCPVCMTDIRGNQSS